MNVLDFRYAWKYSDDISKLFLLDPKKYFIYFQNQNLDMVTSRLISIEFMIKLIHLVIKEVFSLFYRDYVSIYKCVY